MKQLDVFGNEVDYFELNKIVPKETIKERFRRINGYAQDKFCRDCKYFKMFSYNRKKYYKCEKIGVTQSQATDIRLKDCACKLFNEVINNDGGRY